MVQGIGSGCNIQVSLIHLCTPLTCHGEDTGKIEIERSMGKGFEKNPNLRWDFEACRENVLGQNRIGSYCGSSSKLV